MAPAFLKPSIDEVARRAGVNRSTVSKAFSSGRYAVSAETKARIMAAAREIGYEPSIFARRIRARRSRVIALLEDESSTLFHYDNNPSLLASDRLAGTKDVTSAFGYELLPLTMANHPEEQDRLLRLYLSRHFDAIVCINPIIPFPDFFHPLAERGCLIAIDLQVPPHPNILYRRSWFQSLPFFEQVIPYLALQGRKNLFCITSASLPVLPGVQIFRNDSIRVFQDDARLEDDVRWLLERHPKVDAILIANDWVGWKIYQQLKRLGRRVPEEITIAGLSDFRHLLRPLPVHLLIQAPVAFAAREMSRQLIAALEPERCDEVDRLVLPVPVSPIIFSNSPEEFSFLAAHAERLEQLEREREIG